MKGAIRQELWATDLAQLRENSHAARTQYELAVVRTIRDGETYRAVAAANDQHVKNRLNEIDVATAYREGELFESDAHVREYFTVENMQGMGFDADEIPDAETLREWADLVIEHHDHQSVAADGTEA